MPSASAFKRFNDVEDGVGVVAAAKKGGKEMKGGKRSEAKEEGIKWR